MVVSVVSRKKLSLRPSGVTPKKLTRPWPNTIPTHSKKACARRNNSHLGLKKFHTSEKVPKKLRASGKSSPEKVSRASEKFTRKIEKGET